MEMYNLSLFVYCIYLSNLFYTGEETSYQILVQNVIGVEHYIKFTVYIV